MVKNLHKQVRSYAPSKIPKLHTEAGFAEFCLWEIAKVRLKEEKCLVYG